MAGQAFRIVERIFANHILMRIMTRQTTDSRVRSVEAFAVRKPVRLKTDIHFASKMTSHDGLPRVMALATKV